MSDRFMVVAEDGFGSANGETVETFDTYGEAAAFVANPPEAWRGHIQRWPFGFAVYQAYRVDEGDFQ